MILVDTNILYSLADPRESDHQRCTEWLTGVGDTTLLVSPLVVAETCYLLDRWSGAQVEATFLDAVGVGEQYAFLLADLLDSDIRRMAQLVRKYADRRLGGTDASIVAIAERLGVTTVATVNRRDFDNVRPAHVAAFDIVPE